MIHFVLAVVVLVGGTVTTAQHFAPVTDESNVNIYDTMYITPITSRNSLSTLPQVYGERTCPGGNYPGVVTGYRCQNCTARDEICKVAPEIPHLGELDIIPGLSSSQLGLRMKVYNEEGTPIVLAEAPLENSRVRGGRSYRVHLTGSFSKDFVGRLTTLQFIMYDVKSNTDLVCAEADYRVV